MNVIGKLMAAPVLQQRNFTGRDGAAQVFNYRTIVLNCGTDSLAGEMMGETAVRWPHQHLLESVALWSRCYAPPSAVSKPERRDEIGDGYTGE